MSEKNFTGASAELAAARPFAASPRQYLMISIYVGLYVGIGITLVYGGILYFFAEDASVFSLSTLPKLALFLVIYVPHSYYTMRKFDGAFVGKEEWGTNEAMVDLIEFKEHRRFG